MINKAILVGNLGRDPEMKYTPSGMAVCNFSLATSEKWKDKDSGDYQEKTEWHRLVAFGRLAEVCGEYLSKGSRVYVEGRIQTDQYEKDGEKRYSTKIVVREMKMLGGQEQKSPKRDLNDDGPPDDGPPDDDIPF